MQHTRESIRELLLRSDMAVARALVALYKKQTSSEQVQQATRITNNEGFNQADARMGTSMAQFYMRNNYLTPKQIAYWRKPDVRGTQRICKYAGQLARIANGEI